MRSTRANSPTNTLWSDFTIWIAITLILSLSSLPTTWALSDKRLCADEKCEQIISLGTAITSFSSPENGMLSFKIHSKVRILSKSAGNNPNLWGVEINGRRGYANKGLIMENKIYIKDKDLKHEVPVIWPPRPSAVKTEAVVTAPIANNPTTQSLQAQQSVDEAVPVLNASEAIDDIGTTTTSPLDTLKLSILTEQEQTGSRETPSPLTPVQPNIQLVDGTELPLEVVSAGPEHIPNHTHSGEIKSSINGKAEFEGTSTTDIQFDYEDDEEIDEVDDNDNENDDDKPETIVNSNKENKNVADKETTAATVEQPTDATKKASGGNAALPEAPLQAITTNEFLSVAINQPDGIQKVNETPLLVETRNVSVVSVDELTNPTVSSRVEKEDGLTQSAQEIEDIPKPEIASQVVKIEETTQSTKKNPEPKQAKIQTSPKTQKIDENLSKIEVNVQLMSGIPAKQEETRNLTTSSEGSPKEGSSKPGETNGNLLVEVEKVQQPPENKIEHTSEPGRTVMEATKEIPDVVEGNEISGTKSPQIVPDVASPTATPTEAPVKPVSLPPLFKQQHFHNPNDYYKQQENQQLHQHDEQRPQPGKNQQQQEQREIQEEERQKVAGELQRQQKEEHLRQQQQLEKLHEEEELRQQLKDQQQKEEEKLRQQLEDRQHQEKLRQQQKLLEKQQQEERQKQEKLQQQRKDELEQEQEKIRQQMEEARRREHEQLKQQQMLEDQQRQEQQRQQDEQRQREQELLGQQRQQQHEQQERIQQTTPTATAYDAYDAIYQAEATPAPVATGSVEPIGIPAPAAETVKEDAKPVLGLFGTIMNTVNSFISTEDNKEPKAASLTSNEDLHRSLKTYAQSRKEPMQDAQEQGYCSRPLEGNCHAPINLDNFVEVLAAKILEHSLLLLCVVIAAASSLFFIFTYYCFCNSSKEGALLSKLNHLERSLLASHKENLIIKHDLMATRTKLSSIEDNSFGSNDMVVSLKKQLEEELYEKAKLQEQITSLEKDLDNAAEAGLELNKMLSEVLNSQNGDEAFMSTVEELQRQLNDQEKIIIDINASLAEKSRENSELQYSFTESTTRLSSEMKSLQQDNYELEIEKSKLQTRLQEIQAESEQELTKALEARNYEMQKLQHQIMELTAKYDKEHSELQTSLAKIEALEECLKTVKKDGNANVQELITSAKTRGELNAVQKKCMSLQTKLEQELANKARLESQLQASCANVEQLKQDFNQTERDKLEAQTRLEVLSGYFREKETQLQKELSLQEAKWLQHQGENASTVETQTLMKNEIQMLKSQNDELRAEIEAQIASHKAQMGTLENRAHESWLAARQSERRCEEALAEAAGLRRKLTTLATGSSEGMLEVLPANGGLGATELNNAPSPLPLPSSPGLLNMPNPLPFLPAPFSPFMGLPPPFLPPGATAGGARPPPLGRMRSPPPTSSPRDRYSPRHDDRDDYSDDNDYDDDYDDDRAENRQRRHSGNWGRPLRDSYMHSPRTYRSLSPTDSRYNYNDTETDFSPPPSPSPPRKNSSRPISEV